MPHLIVERVKEGKRLEGKIFVDLAGRGRGAR